MIESSNNTHLWQIVLVAATMTYLMRSLPAYFTSVNKLYNYPRFVKFLDYTVCLITGELIYKTSFSGLSFDRAHMSMHLLSAAALALSGGVMYFTQSLAKSFLAGMLFFVGGLLLIGG